MRGTTQFAEIGDISATMQHIAESQDKIGWRHFTEGCISKKFHRRQSSSYKCQATDSAELTTPLIGMKWSLVIKTPVSNV